jgi:hypothetical protein
VLHQVGVSFDLYYDARKHKIKKENKMFGNKDATKNPQCSCTVFAFRFALLKNSKKKNKGKRVERKGGDRNLQNRR